ncbi:hypothetical protein SKAU_G00314510 [Synaphobranchus kaupii]|uniref:Uncharacterized protein n=1 Tax=Synaphobranchus kaupii TaxID=118154 RepID=A0A9Q1ESF8_SYNKA|nr:hypothetical protein SKAU_G00314510 [Synaphobranchus kaupii]
METRVRKAPLVSGGRPRPFSERDGGRFWISSREGIAQNSEGAPWPALGVARRYLPKTSAIWPTDCTGSTQHMLL